MRRLVVGWFVCLVICFASRHLLANADSTRLKNYDLNSGIQLVFLNQKNWNGSYLNSFSFSTDVDYNLILSSPKKEQFYSIDFDLGFTRFADSTWEKHLDLLRSKYVLKDGRAGLSKTASVLFTTSFLNSYEYVTSSQTGAIEKKLVSNSFSPSSVEIGCGIGYAFRKQSLLNLSIATARFRFLNQSQLPLKDNNIKLGATKNNILYFDYGVSLQYKIQHEFSRFWEFNSDGNIFVKAMNRDNVEINLSQNLICKFTGFLQIKADFKMAYNPVRSYKIQLRNEFLVGCYFRNKK